MIKLDHVSYRYSGADDDNLCDASLHIRKGECVVLTGESGCGKTCITRLVNTLIPHFYEGELSGIVTVDCKDTGRVQPHDFAEKIGSVFQNPRSQFFNMDTDSEIVFGLENKGVSYEEMEKRYDQTIEDLHITSLKNRDIFSLSGGEKQTIAFASVYALQPDIYVLDEPSSNLDPQAIEELRKLLILIKRQGKTILISEHRLYFLNGIVDRIIRIQNGCIMNEWTSEQFRRISKEEYVAFGLRSFYPTPLTLLNIQPNREESPVLEVKNLSIGYEKSKPIVSNINFALFSGEIVGVVGKNGCGKTTLARTLCGLQRDLGGTISYHQNVVPFKKRMKTTYLVMQDPNYQLFTESVWQEMELTADGANIPNNGIIENILEELSLDLYKERHPQSLSGGQKQRTAIAVAAISNAEVLILDEPTSGLDFKNMENVSNVLKTLAHRGKTLLVISHDNELLMKVCSRIIYIPDAAECV